MWSFGVVTAPGSHSRSLHCHLRIGRCGRLLRSLLAASGRQMHAFGPAGILSLRPAACPLHVPCPNPWQDSHAWMPSPAPTMHQAGADTPFCLPKVALQLEFVASPCPQLWAHSLCVLMFLCPNLPLPPPGTHRELLTGWACVGEVRGARGPAGGPTGRTCLAPH